MKNTQTQQRITTACATILALTLLASSAGPLLAADSQTASPKPIMLTKGKLILSETFSDEVPASWKAAKGKWTIVKGALQGTELPADEHAASIRTDVELPSSFIFQFDFKFDGGKVIHCSFNGKGHICRATITPNGFTLKGEKVKKDPADKAVTVGQIQQKFETGKWYTMLIEISSNEFVARVSDDKIAFGSHAKIGRAKNNFGFPMAGVSSSIDNLKIWSAKPSDQWANAKKKLPANKIVPPTPKSPKQRFASMDKDRNGQLSLKEFIGKRPKTTHEAITKQFNRRDKDDNKTLSLTEFSPKPKSNK